MRPCPHEEKRDEVQIIHAKFVISSVVILSEIPKIVFITERRIQVVKEWDDSRF